MSELKKPVGIPLKAWFSDWMKDKQLDDEYYQSADIDPYIDALEEENRKLREKLEETQQEFMTCVESFKEACDKLEAIREWAEEILGENYEAFRHTRMNMNMLDWIPLRKILEGEDA